MEGSNSLTSLACFRVKSSDAYVSDHLPSMDELRSATTRPLDNFETLGLIALCQGEDLFISRVTLRAYECLVPSPAPDNALSATAANAGTCWGHFPIPWGAMASDRAPSAHSTIALEIRGGMLVAIVFCHK